MNETRRATEAALDALHKSIADGYAQEIKNYSEGKHLDKEGNPLPIPAALLAGAARFLKDNRIDTPDDDAADPEDLLADELPEFEE